MALHDPLTTNLDNLRFQKDLVDEARKRIVRYCPEWTEYNLSDPGITLIELFAWMTEQMIYRLNLVPRKNYIKFLEMLGMDQVEPPAAATTELTFYLSTPFPLRPDDPPSAQPRAIIPGGQLVATSSTAAQEPVIFTTEKEVVIAKAEIIGLRKPSDSVNYWIEKGGDTKFRAFDAGHGETWAYFYMGFDPKLDISGYILRIHFKSDPAKGSGINRENPPWVWRACTKFLQEVDQTEETLPPKLLLQEQSQRILSQEKNSERIQWSLIEVGTSSDEKDTTGGFNNPDGYVTLYLPLDMQIAELDGQKGYWIRCALRTDPAVTGTEVDRYSEPPNIFVKKIKVEVSGATTRAVNAVIVKDEILGASSGDAGQSFNLKHFPLLTPQINVNNAKESEVVEVEEFYDEGDKYQPQKRFIEWTQVPNFATSTHFDRHYTLNSGTGEIRFGPAVRQTDGSIQQYGRIPAMGMQIRMKQYRYSNGAEGNVPAHQIRVLPNTIPYIDRVTNWKRVANGRDAETLEEAMMRAQRMMRAQNRAVTAADFELLAKQDDRSIARVKCIAPTLTTKSGVVPPGALKILIVPAVYDAIKNNDFLQLKISSSLIRTVRQRLDSLRLLTSSFEVVEPDYLGVFIDAKIVVNERYDPIQVANLANQALRQYVTPLRPLLHPDAQTTKLTDPDQVTLVINRTSDLEAMRAQFEIALQQIAAKNDLTNTPAQPRLPTAPSSPTIEPASYLSPDRDDPEWDGWGFGQAIKRADLFGVLQKVAGVRHVLEVNVFWLDLNGITFFTLNQLKQNIEPAPLNKSELDEKVRKFNEELANNPKKEPSYTWKPLTDDSTEIKATTVLCSPISHRIRVEKL